MSEVVDTHGQLNTESNYSQTAYRNSRRLRMRASLAHL